ncbi:MAG: yaaA [Rhodocyclaceae bacterium]|nr:yaaA [Rhodocyclaceae bacterium]
MLMVLSPAKTLDFKTPPHVDAYSQPGFTADSQILMEQLRTLSPVDIARLMDLSDPLAVLNFNRYAEWHLPFSPENAKAAALAFDGDVYDGLDARNLSAADLDFAQPRLRILSGLYGLLRPLDLIQPYRLEMGTKLANARGKDLYAFWGERLVEAVNAELAAMPRPVLVNLASEEYFKALVPRKLRATVIQPVFEDWKGGRYKIISFYAKRARGMMARFAIERRLTEPEGLQGFDSSGYAFAPEASDETTWVFRRREA